MTLNELGHGIKNYLNYFNVVMVEPLPIFTLCPPRFSTTWFPLKPIEIVPVEERLIDGALIPITV